MGGVTRNVLENLSRLGVRARMVSAVGDDLYGEFVRRESERAGLDMSGLITVPGAHSSCYISMLDAHGDMLVAMSDMGILEHITPAVVDAQEPLIRAAAAVVCDPCLPLETVERIIAVAERCGADVFLDPVSTAYARKVAPLVGGFSLIKPNRLELSVLSGVETDTDAGLAAACAELLGRGVQRVAVSLGERGCYYADRQGRSLFRALAPADGDGQRQRRGGRLHGRAGVRPRARPRRGGDAGHRPSPPRPRRAERAHDKPRHERCSLPAAHAQPGPAPAGPWKRRRPMLTIRDYGPLRLAAPL